MTKSNELSDARMETFDHPCKQTCSGWTRGYEKGYTAALLSKTDKVQGLLDALITISNLQRGSISDWLEEYKMEELARDTLKAYQTDEGEGV